MKQTEREQQMFDLGFDRLERQVTDAERKGYATSGALLSARAFREIERLAERIQLHIDGRRAERGNERARSQGDECLETLVDLYTRLPVDSRSNISQPKLGRMLIAAVVWKTLVDHGFKQKHLDAIPQHVHMTRFVIKTEISRMLYLQHRIRHYNNINAKYFQDGEHDALRKLLLQINSSVMDNESGLDRRLKRAEGLYDELEQGVVFVRRGRKSKGTRLIIPQQHKHGEHYPEWSDLFKEYCANELLDLMLVPKNHVPEVGDLRPFQLIENPQSTSGDLIEVRQCYQTALDEMKEGLRSSILDFLPLVEQPQDWVYLDQPGEENQTGGYHTDEVKSLVKLVRGGIGKNDTRPSELTIKLLNKAQSVQWVVDEDQYQLIRHIGTTWESSYDGISRPIDMTEDDIKFSKNAAALHPAIIFRNKFAGRYKELKKCSDAGDELNPEELDFMTIFEKNSREIHEMYCRASKADKAVKSFVALMDRLGRIREHQPFFYTWSCDYRTRIYPVSGLGQPQGGAPERYTLAFANGERLTPAGEIAALRAIGTAYLDSKDSIHDRVQWSRNNLQLIREIGEHTDRSITLASAADEPLMMLALCRQWVRHEAGEVWTAPVYADATNSGWSIVAALLNDRRGLVATNLVKATEMDKPRDAYMLVLDRVIDWISNDPDLKVNNKKITTEQRDTILDVISGDSIKLGRAISKAYGRTAIYGSGFDTQIADIQSELDDAGISRSIMTRGLISILTKQIERGYRAELGDILKFNQEVKRLAREWFFQERNEDGEVVPIDPDDPDFKLWEQLNRRRKQKQAKKNDLSESDMASFIDVSRKLYKRSAHGLVFTATDGTRIDCRQYLRTLELLQTQFHGRPRAPITHTDALDIQSMIQAVAPALIHSMDAHILKIAYHDAPYDLTFVHDSTGAHPNHFEDMCQRYRSAYLEVTSGSILDDLAKEWNNENTLEICDDSSWRDDVLDSINMFN